tara:strand:+ start:114 stop:1058 length:945 start_codon:yes stop_codon:yes gene_type:complete
MNKKFLYLIPREKRFYKLRDERIISNTLKELSYDIIEINKFYNVNLIKHCIRYKIDGIIFNSLKIGMKCDKFFDLNNRLFHIPLYWWYFDAVRFPNRYKKVVNIAKKTSIFFNKDKIEFKKYKNMNIKPIWLDQGTPSICNFVRTKKIKYDLGYFGSLSKVHSNRLAILMALNKKYNIVIYSKDYKNFKDYGFINSFPGISQSDIGQKVSEIKITLCLNGDISNPYYWSNRIHLMLGSGAFCIVEKTEGLQKFYKDKKDCIYFKNQNELMKKIKKWINSDKRNQIRKNGFKKAHSENSYKNKITEFLNHISCNQ